MSLCPAIFDCNVLAFDKAPVFQTLTERSQELRVVAGRPGAEEPDHWHRWLLRARRQRPCRRAAEQRDEPAPVHSITSSARSRKDSVIVRPSALAVVRLMTRSNLVGCSTGKSAGFAPRKILSTKSAVRLNMSGQFTQ